MEITAFKAKVVVFGVEREASFDGEKLSVEKIGFGEVSWLLALLETARMTAPGTAVPPPSTKAQDAAPEAPASSVAPAASPPPATPAQTRLRRSAEAKPVPTNGATAAPAAAPPAPPPAPSVPKDPAGLAPPGVDPDEPILPTVAPAAAAVTAPPAPSAASMTNVAGGLDMDYIRSTTKLKDIIVHMRERGITTKDQLVERCTAIKAEVAIIARIPNLDERIARTLEVMGG